MAHSWMAAWWSDPVADIAGMVTGGKVAGSHLIHSKTTQTRLQH
jgi:hypothetical protein